MPQYRVTIDGYESGLTEHAVRQMLEDQFPECDVEVSPNEP